MDKPILKINNETPTGYLAYIRFYMKLYLADGSTTTAGCEFDFRTPDKIKDFLDSVPVLVGQAYAAAKNTELTAYEYLTREQYLQHLDENQDEQNIKLTLKNDQLYVEDNRTGHTSNQLVLGRLDDLFQNKS